MEGLIFLIESQDGLGVSREGEIPQLVAPGSVDPQEITVADLSAAVYSCLSEKLV